MKKIRTKDKPFLAALSSTKKYPLNEEFSVVPDADAADIKVRWGALVDIEDMTNEQIVEESVVETTETKVEDVSDKETSSEETIPNNE